MKAIQEKKHGNSIIGLAFAALGVVFGDIGTSPLYALKETFFQQEHPLQRNSDNVLGALSLFFWSLAIVVTLKYIFIVMRAHNRGEGGIFALLALLKNGNAEKTETENNDGDEVEVKTNSWKKVILPGLVVLGACLLYADGVITPAISVLSAWEGLEVASEKFRSSVLPLTYATLVCLFAIQQWGTEKVGKLFGPIMVLWFLVIGGLGVLQIEQHSEVLMAANPWYAIRFCLLHGKHTFFVLGSVVLCITGGEALYADMGHFGSKPIRIAWFTLVYPAILLNYFGQGSKLLGTEEILNNHLFYSLVPESFLVPMVILATTATVIASQALISGAFSLTKQAISLGLFPRLKIIHTNAHHEGQIYIPFVNWVLLLGCILLVKSFETSGALAAAYGIAVTGTMAITTIAFMEVATERLKWNPSIIVPVCFALIAVDLTFFYANTLKFWHGGYVPVLIALVVFVLMRTWQWGREFILREAYEASEKTRFDIREIVKMIESGSSVKHHRIFLTPTKICRTKDKIPLALQLHLERHNSVPERVTFITVETVNKPIYSDKREEIIELHKGENGQCIKSIVVRCGYMEEPRLAKIVASEFANHDGSLVVGEEFFLYEDASFFLRQAIRLFAFMIKLSIPAHMYFGLGSQLMRLVKEVIPIKIGKNKRNITISTS